MQIKMGSLSFFVHIYSIFRCIFCIMLHITKSISNHIFFFTNNTVTLFEHMVTFVTFFETTEINIFFFFFLNSIYQFQGFRQKWQNLCSMWAKKILNNVNLFSGLVKLDKSNSIDRLQCTPDVMNGGSQKLLEWIGFRCLQRAPDDFTELHAKSVVVNYRLTFTRSHVTSPKIITSHVKSFIWTLLKPFYFRKIDDAPLIRTSKTTYPKIFGQFGRKRISIRFAWSTLT